MLNTLDSPWHIVHNRRLMSIPWMRVHLYDPTGQRSWKEKHRPRPEDDPGFGGWVEHYELGKYDLVIGHVDNWSAGVGYQLRAMPLRLLYSLVTDDTPVVVICHGRPNSETNRQRILEIVGDRWLVCNSHAAKAEWEHEKSVAIWHGYRVDEWPRATFQRRPYAVTVCSGGDLSRIYHGIPIIERLRRDLGEKTMLWIGERGAGECKNFDQYRQILSGARVYVHTTQWAPMSGSRTEAMLCGTPVVTTGCDDEALFLADGINAFVTNSYVEMRERVCQLLQDVDLARRIGEAGRETARELFNVNAYAKRWREFVEDGLGLEVGDG